MKGIVALCKQDVKRLLNNALFWIISATLIIIVLVVHFALPSQLAVVHPEIYIYNAPQYAEKATPVSSADKLEQLVRDTEGIGILGTDHGIEVIHTGIPEKEVVSLLQGLEADATPIRTRALQHAEESIPFNKRMLPIFIGFEALIVGFILGGALLLSEKEEETVRAIRIAPVSALRYVLSKTLLFAVLGTVYALLMTVLCVGISFHWAQFLLLSLLGSTLFTLMGLCFTVLFRDMSSWFFSAVVLLSINMLTAIAYASPSRSLPIMRYIPSHPIIFAYRDILFGGGMKLSAVLVILAWCAGLFLLALVCCKRFFLMRR